MLPPTSMLTMIERVRGSAISFLTVILLLTGCTPPGLRAFREGNDLLEKGRVQEAVEQFKITTSILPTNAVAWNSLAVAHHMSGQAAQADIAYQRALALDRDLREARYNLGCLMLEQNKPELARAHFTTLVIRGEPTAEVWVKLGTSHLRIKDLNGAERAFAEALQLDPKNVEALNGLGVVKVRRNRPQEAYSIFSAALKESPEYAPALLNLAVTTHQFSKDTAMALGSYREYLSRFPTGQHREAVAGLVRQLSAELNPPLAQATTTDEPGPALTSTNTNTAPVQAAVIQTPIEKPVQRDVKEAEPKAFKKAPEQPTTAPPKDKAPPVVARNSAQSSKPGAAVQITQKTNRPSPPPAQPKVEVVKVEPDPVFRAAQEAPASSETTSPPKPSLRDETAAVAAEATPTKRTFLQTINPLRLFEGAKTEEKPTETQAESSGLPIASIKYRYSSPSAPMAGNNAEARKVFSQGLQAQSQQKTSEAILAYLRATRVDPAFFEAYFNLAVAYNQAGNVPAALKTYEQALAIKPGHAEARYNFALLLKEANYLSDAVAEFEKLIASHPQDANANLALANIYAQELRQPARARPYFQRVLEIEPRHPQAGAIRYWLSANP